jgi:hypothetical protein
MLDQFGAEAISLEAFAQIEKALFFLRRARQLHALGEFLAMAHQQRAIDAPDDLFCVRDVLCACHDRAPSTSAVAARSAAT